MKIPKIRFYHCSILVMAILVALAWPAFADTKEKAFTRQVMLKAMAQNCIASGMTELATNASKLCTAAQQLMNKPSNESLVQAQQAWINLQLSYKRNQMLVYGPVEGQTFWQANFYRLVYPNLTESIICGNHPIDENLINRVGAPVKGVSAMQYLLFAPLSMQLKNAELGDKDGTNAFSWFLEGKTALRRRQYLFAIAADLNQNLQAAACKAEDANFPAVFAAGGQNSVNLLVNQLIAILESNLTIPLQYCLRPAPVTKVENNTIASNADKVNLSGMKASFDGLYNFYHGAGGVGLDVYLQHVNPGLNDRLEAQFKTTSAALNVIDEPLETMVATRRSAVEKALEETHKLELLLKVDLVSSMGVTIMFNAYDGD